MFDNLSTNLNDQLVVASMITMLIFAMELVGKLVNDISIESIGADLCMLSFSFNVSTLFLGEMSNSEPDPRVLVRAFSILLVVLMAWLISLKLINGRNRAENARTWFRIYRIDFFITMIFGLSALVSQVFLINYII